MSRVVRKSGLAALERRDIVMQLSSSLARNRSYGEPISYLTDFNLNLLSRFSVFDKNNKTLDSYDTVTLPTSTGFGPVKPLLPPP